MTKISQIDFCQNFAVFLLSYDQNFSGFLQNAATFRSFPKPSEAFTPHQGIGTSSAGVCIWPLRRLPFSYQLRVTAHATGRSPRHSAFRYPRSAHCPARSPAWSASPCRSIPQSTSARVDFQNVKMASLGFKKTTSAGSSVARLCVASSNPRGFQLSWANDYNF